MSVNVNRRRVLQALGAAVTFGLADPAGARTQSGPITSRLGLQLYTLRQLMAQDLPGTLSAVAGIGYRELEFAGYFDQQPSELKKRLDDLDLSAPSSHVPISLLRESLPEVLETCQILGHGYVVCPFLSSADRQVGYAKLADEFNQIGAACQAADVRFACHNHAFEFELENGRPGYDILLQTTDPGLVQMELDFFWIRAAGADPLAYFERFPGRFKLCHLKDMAGAKMADVGKGDIDFGRLLTASQAAGVEHFFVEHDNPSNPLQSATNSYQHIFSNNW